MIVKTVYGQSIEAIRVHQYYDRLYVHSLTEEGLQVMPFYLREIMSITVISGSNAITWG